MSDKSLLQIGGVVASLTVIALLLNQSRKKEEPAEYDNVLIGVVGGTNVRLELIRLFHKD